MNFCTFRAGLMFLLAVSCVHVLLCVRSGSLLLDLELQSAPSSIHLGPLSSFVHSVNSTTQSPSFQLPEPAAAVASRPVLIVIERTPWRFYSRLVIHFILSTISEPSFLVQNPLNISLMVSTNDKAYFSQLQRVFPDLPLRILAKPTTSQGSLKAFALAQSARWQEEPDSPISLFLASLFSLFGIRPAVSIFSNSSQPLAASWPALSSNLTDCVNHYVQHTKSGNRAALEVGIPESCKGMFGIRAATLESTSWSESCDGLLTARDNVKKRGGGNTTNCDVHTLHTQIEHRVHPYSIGLPPRYRKNINQSNHLMSRNATSGPGVTLVTQNINQSNHLVNRNATSVPGVTLVTQLTVTRLKSLEAIAARWHGPISAAIYATAPEAVQMLAFFANSTVLSRHHEVYVHVVTPCGAFYPVNTLRNVATRYAVTDHVLVLDADLLPSRDCHPILHERFGSVDAPGYVLEELIGPVAHVVPAFESSEGDPEAGSEPESESECQPGRCGAARLSKGQLSRLYEMGNITGFHIKRFPHGHRPTNYRRFFNSSEDYEVGYRRFFEPYVVVDRRRAPNADERIIGWGFNKIAFVRGLHDAGFRFVVISQGAFLLHQQHPKGTKKDITWRDSSWKTYTSDCNMKIFSSIPTRPIRWGRLPPLLEATTLAPIRTSNFTHPTIEAPLSPEHVSPPS